MCICIWVDMNLLAAQTNLVNLLVCPINKGVSAFRPSAHGMLFSTILIKC